MTDNTLGDLIRMRRERFQSIADTAKQEAMDYIDNQVVAELQAYADEAADTVRRYIDNQIVQQLQTYADNARDAVHQYVDSQIIAAKNVAKSYVDGQITKLKTDNNLI